MELASDDAIFYRRGGLEPQDPPGHLAREHAH
jgi:hypothetical protein